ncbi:MAG: hypothetical protein FWC44_00220 [Methanomassiliicoccaceae archaeon]|nr:hypothetical protein [Methanomassiliicoccaceae archaeon]
MKELKTYGEILLAHAIDDRELVRVFIGNSIEDASKRPPKDRAIGRDIFSIESDTIVSEYRMCSDNAWNHFFYDSYHEAIRDYPILCITIDDSVDIDDPNIRRYMEKGHTYPQAKTLHMYNLGWNIERSNKIDD